MELRPSGAVLGADVAGVDLAAPLSGKEVLAILRALGTYGVLRFPTQTRPPISSRSSAPASARWKPMSPTCSTSQVTRR